MPRPTTRHTENVRHFQVRMLMRAYRESHPNTRGDRGISQTELLRLMGRIHPYYAHVSSHVAVSKWESGDTPPSMERLETFGKALALSDEEVRGLFHLAGLYEDQPNTRFLACPQCGAKTVAGRIRQQQSPRGYSPNLKTVTRTRQCVSCGFTGDSNERWGQDPAEAEANRMTMLLSQISTANDQIRQALVKAHERPTTNTEQDNPA